MKTLISNAIIVNEGIQQKAHLVIEDALIEGLYKEIPENTDFDNRIEAEGLYLFPGIIDDQVHFREPGLTDKAEIATESKAAVAGGVTSFMDMPNTIPAVLTQKHLEEKYSLAAHKSLANYSFYMGASNDNLEEILKTNPKEVCGLKVFMGSSTGNMLVDKKESLEAIFKHSPLLIATHCEDEGIIQENTAYYKAIFGENPSANIHSLIRSAEACYASSSYAVELAKKFNSRLHILHLSTAREMELLDNNIPLSDKKITAEVCVHHLFFNDEAYHEKENFVKWNPAIKTDADRKALFQALLDGKIDVIATDHAPHLEAEKEKSYYQAPSGGPMVQHSLQAMLAFYQLGEISLEQIIEKMCHNPAITFNIEKRGFIRPNYYADLVLVDLNAKQKIDKESILYKCGWSPLEGMQFYSAVRKTFVNGNLVYDEGLFNEESKGMRLRFER
jgi:dihydroorotase